MLTPSGTPGSISSITAAVADASRPSGDRERDTQRKPAECLQFAGVKPGARVVELLPGGGYFTRLFSVAVGPTGQVIAVAPPKSAGAAPAAPEPSARVQALAADPHYANVQVVVMRLAELKLAEPADIVWTSLNYHDVHNVSGIDMHAFNRGVFELLKPGGIYIVIDHAAPAGSGASDTSTLHRIDPETVRSEVLAAGFEWVGQSDVLRNPDDPRTVPVFDASIRGKTDQFVFKFRRPKGA